LIYGILTFWKKYNFITTDNQSGYFFLFRT